MDKMDNQELISALADGQLQGEALARGVGAAASAEGRSTWRSYCVIGEVLRTGEVPAGTPQDDFLARFQERLRAEAPPMPTMALAQLPPLVQVSPPLPSPVVAAPVRMRGAEAANDWRWKMVAGVASVAAVAAVGWNMWGTSLPAAGPQLAVAPAASSGVIPVAAADPRDATMLRDARLDRLLQAHRQLGGATALQSSSGFLRSATFEGPAR